MAVRDALLSRIDRHCAATGMSEREFGYASVQDGRLVERLRIGKATLKVIERAEAFLDGKAADARSARRKAPNIRVEVAA